MIELLFNYKFFFKLSTQIIIVYQFTASEEANLWLSLGTILVTLLTRLLLVIGDFVLTLFLRLLLFPNFYSCLVIVSNFLAIFYAGDGMKFTNVLIDL